MSDDGDRERVAKGEKEMVDEGEGEELDPRVQGELESLNGAADNINTLELELEKSRNKFRLILTHSTQRLNALFKKLGKCVLKARPYYDLLKLSKQSQCDAQKAAANFQRANSIYQSAREMVQLAEERNFPEGDDTQFDSAWQEMLNHATIKFVEAKREKVASEENHLIRAAEYAAIQQKLRFYQKDMNRTIPKAKPYFELKTSLEKQLEMERMNVEDLQMGLVCAKQKYRAALTTLEAISEEIHQKRHKRLTLPPRTPGVGAESDIISLPSIHLDNLSDAGSFISLDDLDGDSASMDDLNGISTSHSTSNMVIDTSQSGTSMVGDITQAGPSKITDNSLSGESKVTDGSQSAGIIPRLEDIKLAPSVGERVSVADGSESISPVDSQEAPLSPEEKAAASGIPVGAYSGVGSTQLPSNSSSPITTATNSPSKRQRHRIAVQNSFPILQQLKDSQKQLSPYGSRPVGYNTPPHSSHGSPTNTSNTQTMTDSREVKIDEVFV